MEILKEFRIQWLNLSVDEDYLGLILRYYLCLILNIYLVRLNGQQ